MITRIGGSIKVTWILLPDKAKQNNICSQWVSHLLKILVHDEYSFSSFFSIEISILGIKINEIFVTNYNDNDSSQGA